MPPSEPASEPLTMTPAPPADGDGAARIDQVEVIDLADGPLPVGDDRYAVAVHAAGQAGFYGPIGDLVAALIRAGLGEGALGHQVSDHRGLHRHLMNRLGAHGGGLGFWAVGAIDCATWDLHGRLTGRPVAELLGARAVDDGARVPAYASWLGGTSLRPGSAPTSRASRARDICSPSGACTAIGAWRRAAPRR